MINCLLVNTIVICFYATITNIITATMNGSKKARRAFAMKRPTAVLNILPMVLLIKPAIEKLKILSHTAPNIPPGIASIPPIIAQTTMASSSPAHESIQTAIIPKSVIIVCVQKSYFYCLQQRLSHCLNRKTAKVAHIRAPTLCQLFGLMKFARFLLPNWLC